MDRANRDDLLALAPDDEAAARVKLLREYGDEAELDVPDPYYGGDEGFEEVLEIVERSCAALLDEVQSELAS
jgi:protein-tyrosine phosphatase